MRRMCVVHGGVESRRGGYRSSRPWSDVSVFTRRRSATAIEFGICLMILAVRSSRLRPRVSTAASRRCCRKCTCPCGAGRAAGARNHRERDACARDRAACRRAGIRSANETRSAASSDAHGGLSIDRPLRRRADREGWLEARRPNAVRGRAGQRRRRRAQSRIHAEKPNAQVRRHLVMEIGEPCLVLRRRTWVGEHVATSVRLWHPASRFHLAGKM